MTLKKPNKCQLNFYIDVVMLLVMMMAAGMGLLIKYVLLPGHKRNIKFGRDVDLTFWGLDRHQWGTLHLIICLILLFLVSLHIFLHWRQIKQIYRTIVNESGYRVILACSMAVLCLFLIFGPLFVEPTVRSTSAHRIGRSLPSNMKNDITRVRQAQSSRRTTVRHADEHRSSSDEIPIYGYMTLAAVAEKYNVSAAELAHYIGVPVTEMDMKLGRLRRQYGFQLSTVRAFIEQRWKSRD